MAENKIKSQFSTKGLKVNSFVRVNFPKSGLGKTGKWQYFTYQEGKRDETGEFKKIRDYQIWVANPSDEFVHGLIVKIKSILSVKENFTTYLDGRKFSSIVMLCEVEKPTPKNRNDNAEDFADFNENAFDINNFNISDDDLSFLS